MRHKTLLGSAFLISTLLSCSSSTKSSIYDGVNLVASAVKATGTGLGSSRNHAHRPTTTALTSALCGDHGIPKLPSGEGGGDMPQSDGRYPTVFTYCAMTYEDGDTVVGGFSLAKSLICSLEKAGVEFAGANQTLTMNLADTECWPGGGPEDGVTTLPVSVVGTSPASFNSHFDKGVVMTVDSIGLTFKIAANLDGDKVEFIAHEDWSGANAGDSLGNKGVMAGEITKSTGQLRFEKRDERIRATCTNSSCGWNRHTRILANLVMSGDTPTGLTSFSYGYIDTQDKTILNSSPEAWASGKAITAKGSLASEIKARYFATGNQSTANMKVVGNWAETANSYCASATGVTDVNCASETGVDKFTSDTKFALYSNPAHTDPNTWLTAFTGFTFTDVNLDVDVAY